jgi:hypothetical protein
MRFETQQPRQANVAEASRVATVKALAMVGDRRRVFAKQQSSQIKAISKVQKARSENRSTEPRSNVHQERAAAS